MLGFAQIPPPVDLRKPKAYEPMLTYIAVSTASYAWICHLTAISTPLIGFFCGSVQAITNIFLSKSKDYFFHQTKNMKTLFAIAKNICCLGMVHITVKSLGYKLFLHQSIHLYCLAQLTSLAIIGSCIVVFTATLIVLQKYANTGFLQRE